MLSQGLNAPSQKAKGTYVSGSSNSSPTELEDQMPEETFVVLEDGKIDGHM